MRQTMISAAILAAVSFSAQGAASLSGFNFDYDITGDKSVRPVQVFDNGQSIYIQLSARTQAPPAVMEKVGEQVRPVSFRYEYPYLVVDNARGEIVLALDGRSALVSRRSSGSVTGAATPVLVGRAAMPAVGGAAQPAAQPSYPVAAPAAAQPDYAGEMVYRNIRGPALPSSPSSSLPNSARQVAGVAAPRVAQTVRTSPARLESFVANNEGVVVHRVRPGETLGVLAARYGVPVRRIAADNGITNPALIRVGQALTINAGAAGTKALVFTQAEKSVVAPVGRVAVANGVAAPASVRGVQPLATVPAARALAVTQPMNRVVPARRIAVDNGAAGTGLIRVSQPLTIDAGEGVRNIAPPPPSRPGVLSVAAGAAEIDGSVLRAVQKAVASNGRIAIRGYSSAGTRELRAALANAQAEVVRVQLIEKGIPENKLLVVTNLGYVKQSSRVDIVLIGAKKHATV